MVSHMRLIGKRCWSSSPKFLKTQELSCPHGTTRCLSKGVTCGRKHKRVADLNLGGFQLDGMISSSIGNLSFLISLDLSNNSFVGTIPQKLGNLFRLKYLDMSSNYLGVGLPASLSNCSRLLILDLHSNYLGEGVPSELGSLPKLVGLYLQQNNLTGKFPASLGNLTSLMEISFGENNMEGVVPNDIARLTQMVTLHLAINRFSGVFPPAIYNLSSLVYLYMAENHFSGGLRPDFGSLLPNLRELNMGRNYLNGAIPTTLANISTLEMLEIDQNNLTGSVPLSFGKVKNLKFLGLYGNSLGSGSFGDLKFLESLTNCTHLHTLTVGNNILGGALPTSIVNLSTSLVRFSLGENLISGSIPGDIGNLIGLQALRFRDNLLTGPLPKSIGKLVGLGELLLNSNRMSGAIPSSIGNITQLEILVFFNNSFEGNIPPSLGNCSYLLYLHIGHNKLSGIIPREILQISPLVSLSTQHNSLSGSLPKDIGRLENLVLLSVAYNNLSGNLPQSLGKCLAMQEIYLQRNSFDGDVPADIKDLVGVKRVDFSSNNLTGNIPEFFADVSSLEYLNLSYNNFEGKVPTQGKFKNATIVSIYGNKGLCGGIKELQLNPCFAQAPPHGTTKHTSLFKKVAIGVSVGIALLSLFYIAYVSLRWLRNRKQNHQTNDPTPCTLEVFPERISYGDIRNATDNFSPNNLIGSGSFGSVYKALLPAENKVVAVKVLNMQRRGAMKSFMSECESLKDIRHRNLVKPLTACSSTDFQGKDFRALVYEFMPNGSLDTWFHPEEAQEIHRPSRSLNLFERLNIAIDVASVFDYLHIHCHEPIAHCDLKPSNVLLDNDLTAHVSDFGLARLLLKFDKESFLNQLSSAGVRGTIGYAAPEYGVGGQPSIQGDVYSFGVFLSEMFTGKRPTNELFGGNFTLHSYVKSAMPERVLVVADESILVTGLRVGFPIAECLTLVFDVGLRCCEESPVNRLAMSDVLKELVSVKERFFRSPRTGGIR